MVTRRVALIIGLILALIPGVLVSAGPAQAATIVAANPTVNDYPWPTANMNSLSPLRYYYRNCTDFVAWRLNKQAGRTSAPWAYTWSNLTPAGGNAYQWKDQFPGKVNNSPALGSVAWWGPYSGGAYENGHVAIVSAVWSDGRVDVEEYNYGSPGIYHTRSRVVADAYIHIQDLPGGPPADGTFVSYNGDVFRIAGGAPIWVSSWANVGGPQPTRALTGAEFAALRQQPADGTFISGVSRGEIYRVVGGAPIYVTYNWWQNINPKPPVIAVDQYAIDRAGDPGLLSHLNFRPADGTFISAPQAPAGRGEVYRIAGGAPVYVTYNWWQNINPKPPVTTVSQEAIDQAGQPGAWSHLRHKPAEGTFISSPQAPAGRGEVYRIAGGAPIYVSSGWWQTLNPKPTVTTVSQEAIDQAGKQGAWSHINYYPADNTLVSAAGVSYLIKAAVASRVSPRGGLPIDPAALTNAGKPGAWSHLKTAPVAAPPPASPPASPVATPGTGQAPTTRQGARVKAVRIKNLTNKRVLIRWKKVSGAKVYRIKIGRESKPLSRHFRTTKPRITLAIGSNGRYAIRIRAIGRHGKLATTKKNFRVRR